VSFPLSNTIDGKLKNTAVNYLVTVSTNLQSVELPTGDSIPFAVLEREVENPRLTLNPDGTLDVIAPENTPTNSLISSQLDWITKEYKGQVEKLDLIYDKYGDLTDGLTLWGCSYELREIEGQYQIHINEETVTISTPSGRNVYSYLCNQIKEALREVVSSLAESYCNPLKFRFDSLSIRDQQTKWASCSTGSTLNFNIRCAFLPIAHLKYLVAHEVAHLKYQDHSEEFWELVSSMCPEYEELRLQLQGFWYAVHRNSTWQTLLSD